mgnify:CR=1 FL=1
MSASVCLHAMLVRRAQGQSHLHSASSGAAPSERTPMVTDMAA